MATKRTKEGYHVGTIKAPSGRDFKITKPTSVKHSALKKKTSGSSGGGFTQGKCVNCDRPTKGGKCKTCN